MLHTECFRLKGSMVATLRKEDGTTETTHRDNIIVNVGFDFVADAIGKASGRPGVMNAIALGTGSNAAVAADAALQTELARLGTTYGHTAGTKVFTFAATFAAGTGTGAITEAGVFNSQSAVSGIMFDRLVFPVINKGVNDVLDVTFSFTMS